jgi:hypothetical protein
MPKIVFPVPGAYLAGVPHRPLSVTAAVAKRLIGTGAFAAEGDGDEPIEFAPEASVLDFYNPPSSGSVDDDQPTEG